MSYHAKAVSFSCSMTCGHPSRYPFPQALPQQSILFGHLAEIFLVIAEVIKIITSGIMMMTQETYSKGMVLCVRITNNISSGCTP